MVEVGARRTVQAFKAAGVEAHGLLHLSRLAALGTHGYRDLEGEGERAWALFCHSLGGPCSLPHPSGCPSGKGNLALSELLLELDLRTLSVLPVV